MSRVPTSVILVGCAVALVATLAATVSGIVWVANRDQTTPPPPTEPPALLIGVADDVDIHVFHDHENRNVCYITTNRLHTAAGGISCVPMAYRDLEDDDVPH